MSVNATLLWQPSLPEHYLKMTEDELNTAIQARKAELGDQVVILGHHYQQDDVVMHADFLGDSFKLSQLAAEKVEEVGAKVVIFCGVHFMAESADILTPDKVQVILPDLSAGCSMADMANYDDTLDAWEQIQDCLKRNNFKGRVIPVTYMNSSAAIKAFVGEHGGVVCTSSNAHKILKWALAGGTQPKAEDEQIKIIFLPDQHLGRNTAADMGYDIHEDMCLYDPKTPDALGGIEEAQLLKSTMILWKGHCSVHKLFRPEHIDELKAADPEFQVIVHPECDHAVVQKADFNGSTEKIMQTINNAPTGSKWAIGTEVHMVNRLAAENTDKHVRILSECQCLCTTMYRIDPQHLLWTLDQLAEGNVINQIKVPTQVRHWSLESLNRMLDVTSAASAD